MKWFGAITDKKDLTTKEYVDDADTKLKESTNKSIENLDKSKVGTEDIVEFTAVDIQAMWTKHVK